MNNKHKFIMLIGFLAAVSSSLSQNLQSLIKDKRVRPVDSELYVRKNIGTGGNINLLAGLETEETGITNFNGRKLDSDRIFVIDAVTLNYGEAAANTSAALIDYTKAIPAPLRNGHLVVKQNGDTIFKIPVASIFDAKNTDERYRDLGGFQLLTDGSTIEVAIEMPDGAVIAPATAGDHCYVEVLLKGFETSAKRA